MKITDPQVILNGEKDLIASVQKNLDLDAVRELLKERLTVKDLSAKGGQIVVHDNEVAFRLDYEIKLDVSLLFDRNGNLLENGAGRTQESDPDDNLSIELPGYDGGSDTESAEVKAEDPAPEDLSPEELSDDVRGVEPGLGIDDLEDEFAFDQDDSDILEADDGDELPDISLGDGDEETGQDMVDDDINDILQESRDFWEKKKD